MLRKITSLMVTLMGLSLLVIAGELAILTYGRAPAQACAGASPQAPGLPAHAVGIAIPTVSSPAHYLCRLGPVARGRQTSWTAALLAAARRIDLRPRTALGQLLQEAEYSSTGPTGGGSGGRGGEALVRTWAGGTLLAMIMLLALSIVAGRSEGPLPAAQSIGPAAELPTTGDGAATCQTPVRTYPLVPHRTLGPISARAPWRVLANTFLRSPDAEWERIRLVPT